MDNFISALQSAGHLIRVAILSIVRQDATWGFLTGFTLATGLYAIIVSENPRNLPVILTKPPADSFAQLSIKEPSGKYMVSYTAFQREYNRVRVAFYLALLSFMAVVMAAILKY